MKSSKPDQLKTIYRKGVETGIVQKLRSHSNCQVSHFYMQIACLTYNLEICTYNSGFSEKLEVDIKNTCRDEF